MAYGKTFWVLYVCFASPEADPGNGESEEMSGIPKNVLDCHGGRRATRRQPDLTIVCIQVRVHVMLSYVPCRSLSPSPLAFIPNRQADSVPQALISTTPCVSQVFNPLAGITNCHRKSIAPSLHLWTTDYTVWTWSEPSVENTSRSLLIPASLRIYAPTGSGINV